MTIRRTFEPTVKSTYTHKALDFWGIGMHRFVEVTPETAARHVLLQLQDSHDEYSVQANDGNLDIAVAGRTEDKTMQEILHILRDTYHFTPRESITSSDTALHALDHIEL